MTSHLFSYPLHHSYNTINLIQVRKGRKNIESKIPTRQSKGQGCVKWCFSFMQSISAVRSACMKTGWWDRPWWWQFGAMQAANLHRWCFLDAIASPSNYPCDLSVSEWVINSFRLEIASASIELASLFIIMEIIIRLCWVFQLYARHMALQCTVE